MIIAAVTAGNARVRVPAREKSGLPSFVSKLEADLVAK